MARTGVISIIHDYGGRVTCNAEWYKSARARRRLREGQRDDGGADSHEHRLQGVEP
jgi:hypothetical protein